MADTERDGASEGENNEGGGPVGEVGRLTEVVEPKERRFKLSLNKASSFKLEEGLGEGGIEEDGGGSLGLEESMM